MLKCDLVIVTVSASIFEILKLYSYASYIKNDFKYTTTKIESQLMTSGIG